MAEIYQKLEAIEKRIEAQAIYQKTILTFNEAVIYLDISSSHLYKLTSSTKIAHYKPGGKKLFFKKEDLDAWLLSNRQQTDKELETTAIDYLMLSKRSNK